MNFREIISDKEVHYRTVRYIIVQYGTFHYGMVHNSTIKHIIVKHNTMKYNVHWLNITCVVFLVVYTKLQSSEISHNQYIIFQQHLPVQCT